MSVKKFVCRENWVGIKVTGMKTTFLVIFDPTWTCILSPKGPNQDFLKVHFGYERQKLYYKFCDSKTG